jgi:hypothetical protein
MGGALAFLNWSPAEFWGSTNHEYQSALEARAEAQRQMED